MIRCHWFRYCHAEATAARQMTHGSTTYWTGVCDRHSSRGHVVPFIKAVGFPLIYLLHFSEPISNHCGHYLGSTTNLAQRLADHAAGNGARLTQVAAERNITFTVVNLWRGGRTEERRMKRHAHLDRLCPHCRPRSRAERLTRRVSSRRYVGRLIDATGPCTHRRYNKRCRRCKDGRTQTQEGAA